MKIINFKYQFLLVVIGLVWINLFDFLLQLSLQNTICNDATNYVEAATMLFQNGQTHYFRPSVLAFLHGIPFLFGVENISEIYAFSYYLNILCWLGFSLVFYKMITHFFSPEKSFIIALCPLFFFGSLSLIFQALSENVFMFLLICAFFNLSKFYKSNKYFNLSIAISLFIIAILVRPGIMFFTILIIVFFIKTIFQNLNHKANIIMLFAISLLVLHGLGMKKQYGNFAISHIDSYTYYNYLGTRADFLQTNSIFNQGNTTRNQFMMSHKYSEFTQIAKQDFYNQLKNNSTNLFKAYFYNIFENTKTGSTGIYELINVKKSGAFNGLKYFFATASKWQNRICTIVGFFLSVYFLRVTFMKRNVMFFISLFILYTIATSAVSCCQGDRFHVIFFPFVVLLAMHYLNGTVKLLSEPLQK